MDWMSLLQLVTSAAVLLLWRRVRELSRRTSVRLHSAPVRRPRKQYPPLQSVIVSRQAEEGARAT